MPPPKPTRFCEHLRRVCRNCGVKIDRYNEEMALPLNGKKSNLKKQDFFEYFAVEQLELNQNIISEVIQDIQQAIPKWMELISASFLSQLMQEKYLHLLEERCKRLEL